MIFLLFCSINRKVRFVTVGSGKIKVEKLHIRLFLKAFNVSEHCLFHFQEINRYTVVSTVST